MPDNVHIGGTSDKTAPAIMCSASIRRPPAKDDSTIALVDTLWGDAALSPRLLLHTDP
jgi:hypothetical protein